MANVKQWVNLPGPLPSGASSNVRKQLASNVGEDVERLGGLLPKATFAKDTTAFLKVRLVPAGDNIEYSDDEIAPGRNSTFFNPPAAGAGVKPAGDTEFAADEPVPMPAAGGNVYRLEGKDVNDKVVKSRTFEAHRFLDYTIIATDGVYDGRDTEMKDFTAVQSNFADRLAEAPHNIKLNLVDITLSELPYLFEVVKDGEPRKVVSSNYKDAKELRLSKAFFASRDVSFVALVVPFIAKTVTLEFDDLTEGRPLGLSGPLGASPISYVVDTERQQLVITINDKRPLWHGLDGKNERVGPRPEDAMLASLYLFWGPTGPVHRDQSHVEDIEFNASGTRKFRVRLHDVWSKIKDHEYDNVQFLIKLRLVDGWYAGISLGDGVIAIAARVFGRALGPAQNVITLLHEFGHMVGLPGVGDKRPSQSWAPDSHDGYYDDHSNPEVEGRGSHCKVGYSGDKPFASVRAWWTGDKTQRADCLMFGGGSGGRDFCADCKKVLRKVDLSLVRRG